VGFTAGSGVILSQVLGYGPISPIHVEVCILGLTSARLMKVRGKMHFSVRIPWSCFEMACFFLSMESCPCELSRAGRIFGIYTVVTWRFCNFVHFPFLTQTRSQIQEPLYYCCVVLSINIKTGSKLGRKAKPGW
jgi:hypothetical protein